jgi:hypothetical protein
MHSRRNDAGQFHEVSRVERDRRVDGRGVALAERNSKFGQGGIHGEAEGSLFREAQWNDVDPVPVLTTGRIQPGCERRFVQGSERGDGRQ